MIAERAAAELAGVGRARERAAWRRIAGAPISWGVCEVPGWGHQLTPERVLDEMAGLGIDGERVRPRRLPAGAAARRRCWRRPARRRLRARRAARPRPRPAAGRAGRARPLHRGRRPYPRAGRGDRPGRLRRAPRGLADGLADAARPARRDRRRWRRPSASPRRCTRTSAPSSRARPRSTGSSTAAASALCLDTGHLLIGGTDPVALAARAPPTASPTSTSRTSTRPPRPRYAPAATTYTAAVAAGLYRPLGQGDLDLGGARGGAGGGAATPAGT